MKLFKDPWRDSAIAKKDVETENPGPRKVSLTDRVDVSPIKDDIQNERHALLQLKGYGGITVDGLADPKQAAGHILKFCVDNFDDVESTLLNYGIVLAQFEPGSITTPFCIQRSDGWTLTVPNVPDRDAGFLQLIQAFTTLWSQTKTRELLKRAQIRPYKM